ncbi:2-amino-4-hydroxy-6-hydroxymethyldihydropteridine diphosphokinase [Sulfuriroseicoccus oceanibius]|uniref:2-amino-4-hydroxy-6-hydroxymethyldihydropteridine pyrophosphokinase n=1 Tax=Sulfuriroseicoccus oceanibius TaxID=2707525 RepID=A0A6B3L2C7_9BACT|nr:2-amino-4-hydroxy-6-hydroxymethyldihydropteridine diphosphokinase [Sulfuriroseicoccus oceanibius]QQL44043.1 2-amino-4-hydroxy-6-hydroxymethyldihydropteridine diphosphokinase [Sulfuriroseicoccus oceanibius]
MRVFIAMGSNIAPRADYLSRARDAMRRLSADGEVQCAPIFSSAPVDCPPEAGEFLNTAVSIQWEGGSLMDLLDELQAIEREFGRNREVALPPNSPRTIDLDILFTEPACVESTPRLQLPHPRLHLRRFVLEPLAALAPDSHPLASPASTKDLLESLDSSEPPLSVTAPQW